MEPSDWESLKIRATQLTERSYAPYSKFHVGAAALTTSGEVITGCNVENASYGVALCAECGLVSSLHAEAAGQITALVVVSGSGEHCTPCGRCRQLLFENSTPDAQIQTEDGVVLIRDLLPGGFTIDRLSDG